MLEPSHIVVKPFKSLKTLKVSVKRICLSILSCILIGTLSNLSCILIGTLSILSCILIGTLSILSCILIGTLSNPSPTATYRVRAK